MTYLIGIDEAGYGPNLGPLCIGVSAWQVNPEFEAPQSQVDLYRLLDAVFCSQPDNQRLAIADSKQLYKPRGSIAGLELPVLALVNYLTGHIPSSLMELVNSLSEPSNHNRVEPPWHGDQFLPLVPHELNRTELIEKQQQVSARAAAKLDQLQARVIHPSEFNARCEELGSKGLALSHWTLALLREIIDNRSATVGLPSPVPMYVTCDKHGGRNNYAGLLSQHFPEYSLRVIAESRPRSAYLLAAANNEVHIEFRVRGESRLETALASMVAKYLRELSMKAFNAFWRYHMPGIKPTAGYPVDAKRFKSEIAPKQMELGIDDEMLWRRR